jgi:hypothetical protein
MVGNAVGPERNHTASFHDVQISLLDCDHCFVQDRQAQDASASRSDLLRHYGCVLSYLFKNKALQLWALQPMVDGPKRLPSLVRSYRSSQLNH